APSPSAMRSRSPWRRESRSGKTDKIHLLDLKNRIDFDREAGRKIRSADREAGVPAGIAEYLDHQVRSTVHHLWHVGEVRNAIDEHAELHAAPNPIEVPAACLPKLGEDVKRAGACRLLPLLHRQLRTELAEMLLARRDGDLARDEHQIAGYHVRDVVGGRG